ncbi:MAG: ferritin [bacterium]
MLSKKMEKALNDQVNAEMYSSYLYLSMASYFGDLNLAGCVSWMKIQALEEMTHAMKFFNFIDERGGRVKLGTIEQPPIEWKSPLDAFEGVLEHERHVTGLVNNLVTMALEEKDHATNNFLQWFVGEQVEEEATADGVVHTLKLAGEQGNGLFMIDRELGTRTFVIPPDVKIPGLAGA